MCGRRDIRQIHDIAKSGAALSLSIRPRIVPAKVLTAAEIKHVGFADAPWVFAKSTKDTLSYKFQTLVEKYPNASGFDPFARPLSNERKSLPSGVKRKEISTRLQRVVVDRPDLMEHLSPEALKLLPHMTFINAAKTRTGMAEKAISKAAELVDEQKALQDRIVDLNAQINGTALSREDRTTVVTIKKNLEFELANLQRKEAVYRDSATAHRTSSEFNRVAGHAARHSSYRWLTWIMTKRVRSGAGMALNIGGMVIMVATAPLMWEGMKQWGQEKFGHSGADQGQGQDQQQGGPAPAA